MFVTSYTIIMDIPRKLLHIPYTTWSFMLYRHLLETMQQKSKHLRNTRCIFLYLDCKLHHLWITVDFHLVNSYTQKWLLRTLQYFWRNVSAQDTDYCKTMHTGEWPLEFMIMWIPEDILTYQLLPYNPTCNSFLDYISLYAVIVF